MTGSINPVAELTALAKDAGALVYVDAGSSCAQACRRGGPRLRFFGLLILTSSLGLTSAALGRDELLSDLPCLCGALWPGSAARATRDRYAAN